ncbi:type II toxin-antitoxin system RelE family toxin [Candidatus Burkholderia verschuerenii]|uniref:type II toxin-antitoxin system RelE family toxin n=1 Tax=Candidatus Burkholderia verschuerenii TaxID=242163 RepID=UPI00067D297C|nr:type II toxin-antitoxin system RelE/ParE family toxin [Candidatus Burkholderia verschuerenii]
MTTYKLAFLPSALKEWRALDHTVREQLKRKLTERLDNPKIESARLSTLPNCYKIKLAALGYRLVYRVEDARVTVEVIAVGKRERGDVYSVARTRTR